MVDQAFQASLEIVLNLMPLNDGATDSFCIEHDASHNLVFLSKRQYEWKLMSPKNYWIAWFGHRTS